MKGKTWARLWYHHGISLYVRPFRNTNHGLLFIFASALPPSLSLPLKKIRRQQLTWVIKSQTMINKWFPTEED